MHPFRFGSLCAALAICFAGQLAFSQNSRTWVSNSGSDSNACSIASPCLTFAGAYARTDAGGIITALNSGEYGTLTIGKSMTIDGGAGLSSTVSCASGNLNCLQVSAGTNSIVNIRNLTFVSTGNASIQIVSAGSVHLSGLDISGGNGGVGGSYSGSDVEVTLKNVYVHDSGNGASFGSQSHTVSASVVDSQFDNNGVGILAASMSKVVVKNSSASGNSGDGFRLYALFQPSSMTVQNSVSAGNGGYGFNVLPSLSGSSMQVVDSVAQGNGSSGFQISGSSGTTNLSALRCLSSRNGQYGFNAESSGGAVYVDVNDGAAYGNTMQGVRSYSSGGAAVVRLGRASIQSNGGGVILNSGAYVTTAGDNVISGGISGGSLSPISKQ